MPSRAVLRKKARREKKKEQKASEAAKTAIVAKEVRRKTTAATPEAPAVHQKRSRDAGAAAPLVQESIKRVKVETPIVEQQVNANLTRKERKKLETQRRLEKQMTRVSAAAESASGDSKESGAERHDPKFKNGTFWRDRKERRARTLFLGGIPVSFTLPQIKDFILTMLDSDVLAADYLGQLEEGKSAVEDIDVLPAKHGGRVKNMYVVLASVPLAGCAAAKIDGYRLENRQLRCNAAADKTQRAEAIRRRG